jgi:hypothetical protein
LPFWQNNRQPEWWRDKKDITLKKAEEPRRTTQEILDRIEEHKNNMAIREAQF